MSAYVCIDSMENSTSSEGGGGREWDPGNGHGHWAVLAPQPSGTQHGVTRTNQTQLNTDNLWTSGN